MKHMQAIPTRYAGRLFRSRLEARWAVFFDAMKFKWDYEPEGFVLSDGTHYLPDFRVTTPIGRVYWAEVKPEGTLGDKKFDLFSKMLEPDAHKGLHDAERKDRIEAVMLAGDPGNLISFRFPPREESEGTYMCPRCGVIDKSLEVYPVDGPGRWFMICHWCDSDTPCGSGHDAEPGIAPGLMVLQHKGELYLEGTNEQDYLDFVRRAINAARSARFEFGQSGAQ